jgi:hypothetical protein
MSNEYLDRIVAIPSKDKGSESYHVGRVVQRGRGFVLSPYMEAAGLQWVPATATSVKGLVDYKGEVPELRVNNRMLSRATIPDTGNNELPVRRSRGPIGSSSLSPGRHIVRGFNHTRTPRGRPR